MLRAYGLAFAQLFERRLFRIVLVSLAITLAIYAGLFASLIWALEHTSLSTTPWIDTVARWGSGLGAALIATLLFPGAVTAVIALWQDAIANAVDARHYPELPSARAVPMGEMLGSSLRLLGLTVVLNLALLPIYAVLLFFPPMNFAVFALVNGLLIGREYFDAAASRRMDAGTVAALRQANRGTVWFAGTIAALILTVPILNLVAPVLATAAFVHLVYRLVESR